MLHEFRLLVSGVVAFVVLVAPAAAQEAGTQVQGIITDSSGTPMPDAAVTVTNQDTLVARTIKPDNNGYYLISPLSPGTYTVTAEKTEWAKYELNGLLLQIGTDVELHCENLTGTSYITSVVSPSFGTVTSANLQQVELAARFVF